MPLPELWWTIFIYGGWIPIVWMLWELAKIKWLGSRRSKFSKTLSFVLLNINVPRANEQTPKAVEHIFAHLAGAASSPNFRDKWLVGKFTPPFSFELCCIDGQTQFVVRTPVGLRDLIEAAVFSQYPDAEITEIADYTSVVPPVFPNAEYDGWGGEFMLAKPNAFPIRTWPEFEHSLSQEFKDPLSSLLESLSRLKKGEQVWIQVLIWPGNQDWAKEAANVVAKMVGKEIKAKKGMFQQTTQEIMSHAEDLARHAYSQIFSPITPAVPAKTESKVGALSPGERKLLEAIEMKISKTGYNTKIRMIYFARRNVCRPGPVISMVRGALGLFGSLSGNSFKLFAPVSPKGDYFWHRWEAPKKKAAIMDAYKRRSGSGAQPFVLNIEELASVWHFPQVLVKAPLIKKVESKKVEPPFQLPLA